MKQGIKGYVKEISGNQMPGPGREPDQPKGIKTTIYVYELTTLDQVDKVDNGPLYSSIRTRLVATADTDSSGYFHIPLPAGDFSIFTKVGDKYFASILDDKNHIMPVNVRQERLTDVNITVNVHAAY